MDTELGTLGQFLRVARERAGLTREHVAAAVGWAHPNSLRHVENGHVDVPRETLVALLEILAVPESEWAKVLRLPRTVEVLERVDEVIGG